MTDMDDEFGTEATWTADAARELGPEFEIPAACRGSGGPGVLRWIADGLRLRPSERVLDCGAGIGGPAAWLRRELDARPVLVEPQHPACAAARSLFDLPVVTAAAQRLPFPDDTFDASWSIAVLCTTPDQQQLLDELHRVTSAGRIGLLVYVRTSDRLADPPSGNVFPTETRLREMVARAGLRIDRWSDMSRLGELPADWQDRMDAVENRLTDLHGSSRALARARDQQDAFARLMRDGLVTGIALTTSGV